MLNEQSYSDQELLKSLGIWSNGRSEDAYNAILDLLETVIASCDNLSLPSTKCHLCHGSGWVQIAPGVRGIKVCPACEGKGKTQKDCDTHWYELCDNPFALAMVYVLTDKGFLDHCSSIYGSYITQKGCCLAQTLRRAQEIGWLNIGFDANGMLRKLADDEIPEA